MFLIKALAMSFLNVVRAGAWRRQWRVTGIRAGVATLPGGLLAWWVDSLRDAGESSEFLSLYGWVVMSVALYCLLGGIFIDHFVARVGALVTWLAHTVWVTVLAAFGFGLLYGAAIVGGQPLGSPLAMVWVLLAPISVAVACLAALAVPGSFPQAKSLQRNVKDVREGAKRIRAGRAEGLSWKVAVRNAARSQKLIESRDEED